MLVGRKGGFTTLRYSAFGFWAVFAAKSTVEQCSLVAQKKCRYATLFGPKA
jgi:hypothetical protein